MGTKYLQGGLVFPTRSSANPWVPFPSLFAPSAEGWENHGSLLWHVDRVWIARVLAGIIVETEVVPE